MTCSRFKSRNGSDTMCKLFTGPFSTHSLLHHPSSPSSECNFFIISTRCLLENFLLFLRYSVVKSSNKQECSKAFLLHSYPNLSGCKKEIVLFGLQQKLPEQNLSRSVELWEVE